MVDYRHIQMMEAVSAWFFGLFVLVPSIIVIKSDSLCLAQVSVSEVEAFNPASCYEDCRMVLMKAQSIGIAPELCDKTGKFQLSLKKCSTCLDVDDRTAIKEIFKWYPSKIDIFEYCNSTSAQSELDREQPARDPIATSLGSLSPDASTIPSLPCIPIICDGVANIWKDYILDINITDVDGCHKVNGRGEIYVLESCFKTPNCIDMYKAVKKQLDDCKNMITDWQKSKGLIIDGDPLKFPIDNIVMVTITQESTANPASEPTISTLEPISTSEVNKASEEHGKNNTNAATATRKKSKLHIFIAVPVSIGLFILAGAGIGIYAYCKKRKNVSDIPDLPLPSIEMPCDTGIIPELAATNKRHFEMDSVREPVEMDTEEMVQPYAELEG